VHHRLAAQDGGREARDLARVGAEVVLARDDVEASDAEGISGAPRRSRKRSARSTKDQFENPANPGAHYATTGPEILDACAGRLDAFVACVGSGGTMGGTSRLLRERVPGLRIVGRRADRVACASPHGNRLVEGIVEDLDAQGKAFRRMKS
jgi:cysteine synthase